MLATAGHAHVLQAMSLRAEWQELTVTLPTTLHLYFCFVLPSTDGEEHHPLSPLSSIRQVYVNVAWYLQVGHK